VKVSAAQIVNGQVAGATELSSLLARDRSGGFASLLDLSGTAPGVVQTPDELPRKHGNQAKDKDDEQGQPLTPRTSIPSAISALNAQPAPAIVLTPWQAGPGSSWKATDVAKLPRSSSITGPMREPAAGMHVDSSAVDEQTVRMSAMVSAQLPDDSAPMPSLLEDLNEPDSLELPEGRLVSPDNEVKTAASVPSNSDIPPARTSANLIDLGNVRPSTGSNTGAPSSLAHADSNPIVATISAASGRATPSHESRSSDGRDIQPPAPGDRAADSSAENGREPQIFAPTQAEHEVGSSSAAIANGWNPNSASETRRGAVGTNETRTSTLFPVSQKSRGDFSGALAPDTSLRGHTAMLNSNHSESMREVAADGQFREPTSARSADENVARLLGNAMRGDLRVGVQTEAFGHVTIQANAQGGQLSAQLSLENAKESAALAAHLPVAEHRLIQQHGVTASVRLAGGFGGSPGGSAGREQSGSNRGGSGRYVAMRSGQMEHDSSHEGRGVEAAVVVRSHFVASKLDVTV